MTLPTAGKIYQKVFKIHRDKSFGFSETLDLFNECYADIAAANDIFLPLLETDSTVNTVLSQNYVDLPTDFQKKLLKCYSVSQKCWIEQYSSISVLLGKGHQVDDPGAVWGVAIRNRRLYYQYIPETAETLKLYYYKTPTLMTDISSTPDALPDHLAEPLLKSYACWKIYDLIEDGVDDPKINTIKWEREYNQNLFKLKSHLGPNDHGWSGLSA